MTVRACCKFLLVGSLINAALADQAGSWLERMSHSFRELTYQGTLSYQRGDHMQSLRIAHTVIDGKEYERLEYLDGKKREVVRRNHSLKCIHPGEKLVRFFAASESGQGAQARTNLLEHYQVSVEEKGRIAGRDIVELHIAPKDEYRYGYRLALDEETGLMVRSELVDEQGDVLERFQFVELEIGGDIAPAYFQEDDISYRAPHDGKSAAKAQLKVGDRLDEGIQPWIVQWTPDGFVPVAAEREFIQSDMLTYTDGMTVFSVFLEPYRRAKPPDVYEGTSTKGATSAYFKILQLAERPHRVTVVGEIPPLAAKRIADSVALAQ